MDLNKYQVKKIAFFLFIVLGLQLSYAQCPNIVWEDDFSGNTLDLTKWNYQIGDGCAEGICGWGNNELQSYQEANVNVSNGTLKITAQKQRIRGSKYTSGRINSKAKADFTYGRFEASIKLPYGDGLWPAFWMLSTDEPYGGWPQSGEIDIMEFVASQPDRTLGYMHYGDPYPNNQSQGSTYTLPNDNFPDAFHEFAIEWEPGIIRWFVDDILFSVKTSSDVSPFAWPFDHDFHFLLNVAVGGNLGGTVNESMLPATMEVDYVRVYDGYKPYLGGSTTVANLAQGETYTIGNLANGSNVSWTVPLGASVVSGQGTGTIVVDFGDTSGNISAIVNDGCENPSLSMFIEVEPPYILSFSFENFDDPGTVTLSSTTGTLTELTNPAPNAINSSAISGQYDRNSAEQYDVIVYNLSNITDASQYVNKDKKFYIDVYTSAPVGTEIILQLETPDATPSNYPTGRHSRYVATINENNNWQRLAFSLLDRPDSGASDANVSTMILLFASNGFTGDTYFYDNLDSYQVDNGGGTNQPPTVSITSPNEGATITEGNTISIIADASDPDGTIAQVEFFANGNSIGVDNASPYAMDWIVANGSSSLTALATDNESASTLSQAINITGQTAGTPTSVHVASIVTGTASASKGSKFGTATVTIINDLGNPVANALVTGTFSGTFNQQISESTDGNGVVVLQTTATAKGSVTVNLCVDDVVAAMPYNPSANIVTCSGAGAKIKPNDYLLLEDFLEINIYPNPAKDIIIITINGFGANSTMSIYDSTGRVQLTEQFINNNGTIDVSSLVNGLYFVRVEDESGQIKTTKLIK